MRHPGSPRVEELITRSASWLLFVGWVVLAVRVVLMIGAALPGPDVLTAKVAASARHDADMSALEHGSRQEESDPDSTMGLAADMAPTADNDRPSAIGLSPVGSRGALHAGDRSPIAVSDRLDLRLGLMGMADWRRPGDPVVPDSCLG